MSRMNGRSTMHQQNAACGTLTVTADGTNGGNGNGDGNGNGNGDQQPVEGGGNTTLILGTVAAAGLGYLAYRNRQ